ncbi:MAG: HEAT repeat domain-containing protein [Bradymonadaceae bacterium]|nr:HEAT repeat domain-containing protein [Lujinxingiaceae bacterium]
MARIQLVTDVSKWGLLKWPAQTRPRLIGFALLMAAATVAFGLWSADYVLNQSASVAFNLVVITANMMMMLVAAFLQTVLIADLFFAGPWRERVFLGLKVPDGEIDPVAVEDRNAEFVIALLLLVIANAFALNVAAGGFLDFYHNEGFFQVRLRADSASERIAALEDMADPINNEIWERPGLQDAVVARFGDVDLEVRKRALWNAGRMKIQPARPQILALLERDDEDPGVRAEAAVALGKLGDDTAARRTIEAVLERTTDSDLQVGCLRALGLMASPLTVSTLARHSASTDEPVMLHALWALGRIRHPSSRKVVKELLDTEPTGVTQCATLDAFKMVANAEDTVWARREFQRVSPELDCQMVTWDDREGTLHYIVWGETVRIKLLKIVANTNPFDHRDWIQRLVNDSGESWRVREVADEILKQMNKANR